MRLSIMMAGSALALLLAGCNSNFAGTTATGARPAGVVSTAPGAASKEPEPANSLPVGAAVAAPVTNRVGNVGTTRY